MRWRVWLYDWHPLAYILVSGFFAALELFVAVLKLSLGEGWGFLYLFFGAWFIYWCYNGIKRYAKDKAKWEARNTRSNVST